MVTKEYREKLVQMDPLDPLEPKGHQDGTVHLAHLVILASEERREIWVLRARLVGREKQENRA